MNNVQLNTTLPTAFSSQQTKAALNNSYANALAMGDPRMSVKPYDKGGMSRGGAQWNQAGIDSAQKMSQGIAEAYSRDVQNNQYNANTALAGQQAQESQAQALGALQQQQGYANQMAQLQRQNMAMNFATSLLGGLLK
jgi:hypothetical protein